MQRRSIYSGMPTAELQSQLLALQRASLALAAGGKVVTATYAQGDGSKSVTYTQANMGALTATILELQQLLGVVQYARTSIQFNYGYRRSRW